MKWAVDPARPWRGVAPLEAARATGQLAASLEQRLGEEAGQPVGAYLALPKRDGTDPDAADDPDALLRADIRAARRATSLCREHGGVLGRGKGRGASV